MTTPPKVTDSVCMSGGEMVATTDLTENAIEIHGQFDETVMFTVIQTQTANIKDTVLRSRFNQLVEKQKNMLIL